MKNAARVVGFVIGLVVGANLFGCSSGRDSNMDVYARQPGAADRLREIAADPNVTPETKAEAESLIREIERRQ